MVILCFIHPVAHELVISVMRATKYQEFVKKMTAHKGKITEYEKSKVYMEKMRSTIMNEMALVSLVECIMIFYRRFMIGVIVDQNILIIAVAITGIEEILFRSTLVPRDRLIRAVLNQPIETEAEE